MTPDNNIYLQHVVSISEAAALLSHTSYIMSPEQSDDMLLFTGVSKSASGLGANSSVVGSNKDHMDMFRI